MADHKDPAGVGQSEIVEASTSSSSETHSPPSDRTEIWSWYAYYAGNNGLSLFNFGPAQFQNLLAQAADPKTGLLPFLGQQRSNNSIVLLSNGISFAIQAIVFLTVGSYADFGTWRPNILIFCSAVAYGIGFGWLGVTDPAKWRVGVGLYMVGLIAYQTCLTFWTAAFPGLARNSPQVRAKIQAAERSEISQEDCDQFESLERSRLSNIALYVQSVTELGVLAVVVGILFGLGLNTNPDRNTEALSVTIAFCTGFWLLNVIVAGLRQLWDAFRKVRTLKQTVLYLAGYFMLGDSLNTTVTVIATLQNQVVEYSTLDLTYLLLVGIGTQAIGIYLFWFVQRRFELSTKVMFNAVVVCVVLLDGWGMVGIWQQHFGFHNRWEFWLYQGFYGLLVCPWYSYSQIMISEVTPAGHEFLFFSLFSIMGKASSFVGPIISSAIIDASPSQNASTPFYFLFGLSLASLILLIGFLDVPASKREQRLFLEYEAKRSMELDQ